MHPQPPATSAGTPSTAASAAARPVSGGARRTPRWLASLLLAGVAGSAGAADLQDLFTQAQRRDPFIAEARARFDATHTRIAQGRAQLLPTLTLQGNTARNAQAPAASYDYDSGFNSHGYGLNLSQNLLNFEAWYTFKVVRHGDRQALATLAQNEQQLILRVARAYFDVLRSQENLRSFVAAPVPADLVDWEALTVEHSPAVEAARMAFEASKDQVRSAKAALYPTLSLGAQYNYNAESANHYSFFANTASQGANVSLNVRVPLYAGGANTARAREALYNRNATEYVLRQVERTAEQDIRNAWRAVQTDVVTVEARQQALESASSALASTETGAQIGTRNIVDVVLAQRTLFQAQRDLANARYTSVVNTLQMKAAAGVLSPEDVRELNGWLE